MISDFSKDSAHSCSHSTGDTVRVPLGHDTHLYVIGEGGHIYKYAEYPANSTAEPMCTILGLAVDDDRIRIEIDGREYNELACITAPQHSTMLSSDARTAGFVYYPTSATHRAMQSLPTPRVLSLNRERFRQFDSLLSAAAQGALAHKEAVALFDAVTATVATFLPTPTALDPRVATVAATLYQDPTVPIGALAEKVKLSPDRLSHLFTDTIGIDLRRYRLWLKVGRVGLAFAANQALSMSELARLAGFSDSAHMSRAVKEVFGGSPTRFLTGMKIHGPES